MSTKSSIAYKKRGASAMLCSGDPSVDVLDKVKEGEDTEDRDNVVSEQMMATLYSPAVARDKGVGGADEKKFHSVITDEKAAVNALAQALEPSVMRMVEVADYEVHDGDYQTWFQRGPFTSLKPDEMDEIAVCFAKLAKIRRVQDAALVGL